MHYLQRTRSEAEAQTSILAADGHVEEDLGGNLGAGLKRQHHWPLHQGYRLAAQNITPAPARMGRFCSSSKNKLGGGRGGDRGVHGEEDLGALLVALFSGKAHRETDHEERGEENGASHLGISDVDLSGQRYFSNISEASGQISQLFVKRKQSEEWT